MATEIKTKFAVGDVVYAASVDRETKRLPCPDCKGSRKWKVVSPAGAEHEIGCPRCSTNYMANSDLRLTYTVATPRVRKLTIGSVEYRSVGIGGGPAETRYMCRETGVGSGQVYSDDDLHSSEEAAMARAEVKAKITDEASIKGDTYWHGRLEVSDFQLVDARYEAASQDLRRLQANVRHLVQDVREALEHSRDLKSDVAEAFASHLDVSLREDA